MQSLKIIGANINQYLVIEVDKEQTLDLMNTPIQSLKPEMTLWATVARTKAASRQKIKRGDLEEVDTAVHKKAKAKLDDQDRKKGK